MQSLQSQQMWDMMRAHQAELLKEAQKEQLVRMVTPTQTSWLSNLFRRQAQPSALMLNTSVTAELG
jgi:hypothetical protein